MKDVKVVIPEEDLIVAEYEKDDQPGIVVINLALEAFEGRDIFSWHLSFIMEYEDLIENGMPSQEERDELEPFMNDMEGLLAGSDTDKPNGLFLARHTWNGTVQLVYRIFDPEPVNHSLQRIIDAQEHPRPFDYRIDHDEEWEFAKWYFQ